MRAQVNKRRFHREGEAAIWSQAQGGGLATQENAGSWSLKPAAAKVMQPQTYKTNIIYRNGFMPDNS